VQKDDRKDVLFIFLAKTASSGLKGRTVTRLSRDTIVTALAEILCGTNETLTPLVREQVKQPGRRAGL